MACKRNNMILKLWPKKQAKKNLHNSGLVIGAPLRPLESLDYQKEKKKKRKKKRKRTRTSDQRVGLSKSHQQKPLYFLVFDSLCYLKKKKKQKKTDSLSFNRLSEFTFRVKN